VTSRNCEETMKECLQALFNQDYPKDSYEVIVIDARSTDATVEIAKNTPARVFSEPLNAAAAYNYVMKVVRFDVLGFVDADAKVESSWLKKLVPHLAEAKVAGVSGSIETWNTQNAWARSVGYEIKNRYSRIGKYTGRIATMNLLLKKRVVEEVGGWDEDLPSQYDTDFGYRMSKLGYRIAYEPNAKCYHFNRETVRAYWRQQKQYGKNTLKLYFKHGHLAKGDEITDLGMNIQPALYLAMFGLFIAGIVPLLRVLWYGSAAILLSIICYYALSAARIARKFRDRAAMRLFVLYFVRTFAWLTGAAITTWSYLSGKGRRSKK
jgi:cellulose synthase/poly-beta-1,6-N-acetylglucosamine synthase-like glycosyltransferase